MFKKEVVTPLLFDLREIGQIEQDVDGCHYAYVSRRLLR